jgi:hypothetical protein
MSGLSKDNIVRMAIDAIGGDMNGQDVQHLTWRLEHFKDDSYKFGSDALLKFVALVAAAEREACAKVCEAEGERVDASWVSCAFAIRERGAP